MNERQEQTSDILGKLTVLGTIVLPMNIICGMWGMNVKVPGQEVDNLYWFYSSKTPTYLHLFWYLSYTNRVCVVTAGLVAFAVACFVMAKRVYGIM